ncbi:MAG: hypothetical protein IJZ80_04255 [Clostridia bacterium]|nr:hypothetical protein [Clostridia bacterium]
MKVNKTETNVTEKMCKKCGKVLASTTKYRYCDNCRRGRAKTRREALATAGALGIAILSVVPVVKHLVNKK